MNPLGIVLSNVNIEDIKPYAKNPRKNDKAVIEVKKSIEECGYRSPIIVDENMVILAGHTRWKALKELGWKKVPKVIQYDDLTPKMKDKYRVRDNKTSEFAEWDYETLTQEFEQEELLEMGFDVKDLPQEEIVEDEAPPVPETPRTVKGDIYQLGKHRLICGDSTISTDVYKLLQGKEPYLMVTDPPYGVDYDANWRNEAARNSENMGNRAIGAGAIGKVENDNNADWSKAWVLSPSSVAYVYHAGIYSGVVQKSLENCNFNIRSQIIWVKNNFAISRGDYHWKHEPCWYAVKKGNKGNWASDRKQTTVWEIDKPQKSETGHSTQKPIECMARAIRNHDGDVYDPFCGSGSTLIACEQLARKCYAIEISEKYCDVIVQRWVNLTGGEVILNGKEVEWHKNSTETTHGS